MTKALTSQLKLVQVNQTCYWSVDPKQAKLFHDNHQKKLQKAIFALTNKKFNFIINDTSIEKNINTTSSQTPIDYKENKKVKESQTKQTG